MKAINHNPILTLLLAILFFSSCKSYQTVVKTKPLNTVPVDSLEYYHEVKLYEGKCLLPDSTYIRIEEIKIKGDEDATLGNLLDQLRMEARHKGANAVIEIKAGTKQRAEADWVDILLAVFIKSYEPSDTGYEAVTIKGVAVYIKSIEDYSIPNDDNQNASDSNKN